MSTAQRPPDDTPATSLFPRFREELYGWVTSEIKGLSAEHLDFDSDRWGWSGWSIRRQVSHLASGDYRWFLLRWGPQLFPQGLGPR